MNICSSSLGPHTKESPAPAPGSTRVRHPLLGSPLSLSLLICCRTEMRPSFFAGGSIFTTVEELVAPCSSGCPVTKASCLPRASPASASRTVVSVTQSPRQGQSKGSLFAELTAISLFAREANSSVTCRHQTQG